MIAAKFVPASLSVVRAQCGLADTLAALSNNPKLHDYSSRFDSSESVQQSIPLTLTKLSLRVKIFYCAIIKVLIKSVMYHI